MTLKQHLSIVHFVAFALCLFCSFNGMAQERRLQNRPYLDTRRFHYGFLFGVHSQDMEFTNNGYVNPENGERWYADADRYALGFNVGVLGEWKMTEHLSLRVIPTMYFGQKHIAFHEQTTARDTTQNIKSTYMSVPIDLKFSAQRFNNYRPYVMAGISPCYDLTTKKQGVLLPKRFDVMMELGIGCDFYLPFFKLIPELKFCFGLLDVLNKDRRDLIDKRLLHFTEAVDDAHSKMVVLTFYFE